MFFSMVSMTRMRLDVASSVAAVALSRRSLGLRMPSAVCSQRLPDIVRFVELASLIAAHIAFVAFMRFDKCSFRFHEWCIGEGRWSACVRRYRLPAKVLH